MPTVVYPPDIICSPKPSMQCSSFSTCASIFSESRSSCVHFVSSLSLSSANFLLFESISFIMPSTVSVLLFSGGEHWLSHYSLSHNSLSLSRCVCTQVHGNCQLCLRVLLQTVKDECLNTRPFTRRGGAAVFILSRHSLLVLLISSYLKASLS